MPSPPGVQISTFGRLSALPREAVGCLPGWFQLKARSQSRTLWCLPGALHGDGLDYSAVSIDDPRIGRDLSSGFKALFEPLHVLRHLAGGLATDDEGDEQLSDPVTGEVHLDHHPRS
jgi:hypothetical protein